MNAVLSLVLQLLVIVVCFAQKQNNVWYFGNKAGIDFNSGSAVAITTPTINALEGTSSICDTSGNLSFYTDGVKVWDKTHSVMPNGSGILGGTSTSQVLIVPKPNSGTEYYIFHVADHLTGSNDFRYTVVDMCQHGGLGDVVPTQKNILIHQPNSEKITAIPHSNGTDIWIISHELNNNMFTSYLLTSSGLNMIPIQSNVGAIHFSNQMIGCMNASHNGKKIALGVTFNGGHFELFDFNSSTGSVSNAVDLVAAFSLPTTEGWYDMEFNINDSLLYVVNTWNTSCVYQLNFSTNVQTPLTSIASTYTYAGIQLGPDGKIYVTHSNQNYLDVINNPNISGTGCNFVAAGFTLAAGSNGITGLPSFIPASYLAPVGTPPVVNLGNDTAVCASIALNATAAGATSYLWSTGATTPSISVVSSGSYWVNVSFGCYVANDTITISGGVPVNVSQNISICPDDSVQVGTNYYNAPGTYTDTLISVFGCDSIVTTNLTNTTQATITVTNSNPQLCLGNNATLTASGAMNYTWSPPSSLSSVTGSSVVASPSVYTTYTVIGTTQSGCADTVLTTISISTTAFDPGNTQLICYGDSAYLSAGGNATTYTWSPSSSVTNPNIVNPLAFPTITTTYTVMGTNALGCVGIDSQTVVVYPLPSTPTITVNGNVLTSSSSSGNQWLFNGNPISGATAQTDTATQDGSYQVMVTDTNGCTAISAPYVLNTTNIAENTTGDLVIISPNPSGGIFSIKLTNEILNVEIVNIIGEKISTESISTSSILIDISRQPDGIYFVKAQTINGVISHKIILAR